MITKLWFCHRLAQIASSPKYRMSDLLSRNKVLDLAHSKWHKWDRLVSCSSKLLLNVQIYKNSLHLQIGTIRAKPHSSKKLTLYQTVLKSRHLQRRQPRLHLKPRYSKYSKPCLRVTQLSITSRVPWRKEPFAMNQPSWGVILIETLIFTSF